MTFFQTILQTIQKDQKISFNHTPKGYEGFLLKKIFEQKTSVLYIARDDASLNTFKSMMRFYAPELPFLFFPSPDTLPYDQNSPKPSLTAERTETLFTLSEFLKTSTPVFVATSPQAFLQRLPPPSFFQNRSLLLKKEGVFSYLELQNFLHKEGYRRVEVVHEPGEFSVRGGFLDLFTPSLSMPVRLDFFGDHLQTIHPFDPVTQLKHTESLSELKITPSHEILLNEETIRLFRTQYRELFGSSSSQDALYKAITEKRPYPGYEQWMPLFFNHMKNLWDYMKDPIFAFEFQAPESLQAAEETLQDHYNARLQDLSQKNTKFSFSEKEAYRPLSPHLLYASPREVQALFKSAKTLHFTPFQASSKPALDCEGKLYDWSVLRSKVKAGVHAETTLFEEISKLLITHLRSQRAPLILVGYSPSSLQRLSHLLKEHFSFSFKEITTLTEIKCSDENTLYGTILPLEQGFETPFIAFITEQDILGERLIRPSKINKKAADQILEEISSFSPGDLLVHVHHGIGRYEGLLTLDINGSQHDCLELSYEGGDKLFVPVENMDVLSRFGGEGNTHPLDKLGSAHWQSRKARVKKRIKEVAEKLMAIAARRSLETAPSLETLPSLYEEFCNGFPFIETEDQLRVCEEVMEDLSKTIPMDRLVCGDVGFGKTEIALRAAFIAATNGKQVAIVAPTTLLARQHFKTFEARFKNTNLKVVELSRLLSPKEAKENRSLLEKGEAQILISTHAAFSKSLTFKDLGLLIIDEEQHFGVTQKDKLKEKYPALHILTLTATPIPRTLQMSLTGIRDLSLITTPPVDRMAVKTFVMPFDGVTIREALLREHFRGGQSFYVAPRIEDLTPLKTQLSKLVPELKVLCAHGQLSPTDLENVMSAFYEKKCDVLLSTNIIESGLDVASANTLIIHKADYFGLSQLYQLRGRVGRSKVRGYAYLTYAPQKLLTENAKRRLTVLETLDTLGIGFSIASHDMDIRGAGNLVGEEQSGHIKEIGIELYQHLLKEAIEALKTGEEASFDDTMSSQVSLEGTVMIPETYIPDLSLRLSLYKRLSNLRNDDEIKLFSDELLDRFGALPKSVQNLLEVISLKRLAEKAGLEKVEIGPKGVVLTFYKNLFKNPLGLVDLLNKSSGALKLRPDHKLFFVKGWTRQENRLQDVKNLLITLGDLAQKIES
ncbi:MAG: transcription-repair coupling factor [Proteobacteria bacterium]|nr:transcription-repair coupling factor [Pseudomonadota bacterium]